MNRRILLTLLSIVLVIALLPVPVFSEEIYGDKTASPTALTIDNRQTDITLSFPAADYIADNDYDIVFCMDFSTSAANSQVDFAYYAKNLLDSLSALSANINVGVVKFKGIAFDILQMSSGGNLSGLTRYSESTADAIADAIEYDSIFIKLLSAGTNVHGGLEMAQKLLDDDTTVADDHKYLILLTDGKTYIWNDENGESVTNYTQYYKQYKIQDSGKAVLSQTAGCIDKSAYPINNHILNSFLTENNLTLPDVFWFKNYTDLYNSDSIELSGETKYDMYCAYAYMRGTPTGNVTTYASTNALDVFDGTAGSLSYANVYKFTPNNSWSDITWFEANPFEYEINEAGTVTFTGELNPDFYQWHPDALMKGLYKAGHLWNEIGEKYNTSVITYDGWGSGTGLEIAKSFCSWIRNNCDIGADISSSSNVQNLFDAIENQVKHQVIYAIDSGILTDIIPGDFGLVKNGDDTFTITVENAECVCTLYEENEWYFGEASEGIYPYSISFNEETNTIIWYINVPVETLKPVSLSYALEIDKDSPNGNYDTNISAIIEYWCTTDDKTSDGRKYEFDIPKVTYYVPDYTVTFKAGDFGTINSGTDDVSGTYRLGTVFPNIPLTDPNDNYVFDYWMDISGNRVSEFPETVTADAEYTAIWKQVNAEYKVEHYLEQIDGSYILADEEYPVIGEIGQTVSVSAREYANYEYSDEKSTASGVVIIPEIEEGSDTPNILTLKLYYDLVKHTVTFKAGDYGKINGSTDVIAGNYKHGAVYPEIPATTGDNGFAFDHWIDSEGNVVTEFPETVTEDAVYTAVWFKDIPVTGDSGMICVLAAIEMLCASLAIIGRKRKTRKM